MKNEKRVRGLGVAGLSLVAGLLLSGMAFAQDAQDGPDIVIDDGDMIVINHDMEFDLDGDDLVSVDPICIECSGDPVDDWTQGDDAFTGEDDTGLEGDVEVTVCDGDVCEDFAVPGEELDPQILYMNGAGGPLAEGPDGIRSGTGAGADVLQRGPDLCQSPAQELVWLCALVSGKPKAE